MDKLSQYDEKWPGQESAEPIGSPPKGMWYDPKVKDGADIESAPKGLSLNDALRYFLANPSIVGKPFHIDIQTRTVQFDNGKVLSFEEVMDMFSRSSMEQKTSDYGLMDGPKDLGKKPSGDFPSVMWMPRGEEDLDVDPNITTADLGLSRIDKQAYDTVLTQDQMNEIAAQYGSEYNSAITHYDIALRNGHPKDRALAYAVSEMKKMGVTISPTTLLDVINTYL